MIIVNLALATICFAGQCYPALVGPTTPKGEFTLTKRIVSDPGYGGDILKFSETQDSVFAIHRVWTLVPSQRRLERLTQGTVGQRQSITNGCINVMPEVYDKLMNCCIDHTLVVR